jgi:thioredoxin 1
MGFLFPSKATLVAPGRLGQEVAAGGAVLVEFVERGAPACRLEAPVVAAVIERYASRLRVLKVDAAAELGDAQAYRVAAVPTFVLFVDGVEKDRLVGYQSVDDLTRFLDGALPASA